MPMTGVINGVVTPKDKAKSNSLARLKVRIFTKSMVSFYTFPLSYLPDFPGVSWSFPAANVS